MVLDPVRSLGTTWGRFGSQDWLVGFLLRTIGEAFSFSMRLVRLSHLHVGKRRLSLNSPSAQPHCARLPAKANAVRPALKIAGLPADSCHCSPNVESNSGQIVAIKAQEENELTSHGTAAKAQAFVGFVGFVGLVGFVGFVDFVHCPGQVISWHAGSGHFGFWFARRGSLSSVISGHASSARIPEPGAGCEETTRGRYLQTRRDCQSPTARSHS